MSALRERARRRASSQRGFNMVELMVVVCIIATLSLLAIPSMRDMIRIQRVKTASFDVFAGLVLARSEAIKRNVSVTLTPTGGDWAGGWTATDANGTVLARQDPLSSITVTGPATVVFNGMGRIAAGAGDFAITAADIPAASYRCVKLNVGGRPYSKTGACP